jgi:hypothetical protein
MRIRIETTQQEDGRWKAEAKAHARATWFRVAPWTCHTRDDAVRHVAVDALVAVAGALHNSSARRPREVVFDVRRSR